jgi:cytosine deaminase
LYIEKQGEKMAKKRETLMIPAGEFGSIIHENVVKLGGYVNAHAHLDRSGTLDPDYLEHYSLTPLEATNATLLQKQNLTGELHKGCGYSQADLERRMGFYLREMGEQGVKEVVSFIDVTPDVGLSPLNIAGALQKKYRKRLKFRLAIHPIFGFKLPERWELFVKAAHQDDVGIIGALPEKDERADSIGLREHIRRVLKLGIELNKEVHIHVDQANEAGENISLDVLKAIYGLGTPTISGRNDPTVWLIHVISPSAYDEKKFGLLIKELVQHNIGVICCPRAAISMRQMRSVMAPTHNSIARIMEMAYAGVPIRIGTDNIADMFVPTGSGSMLNEILVLSDIIRYYDPRVLAKFAAGAPLNETDRESIRKHLVDNEKAWQRTDPNFKLCVLPE